MAGYSSRRDQLWQFAAQLFKEEERSIPFTRQEEHGQRIQAKYRQLASNLSSVGDIIATMYQKEKLELDELEQIQHLLQSTPIRANEELLSIIARKPRDVYECFLSLIKDTKQLHLYQMLVSDDDTYDEANTEDDSEHKHWIRRNYSLLSEKLVTEIELISKLYEGGVLTVREKEEISCEPNTFRKSELLLGLISKKSSEDFEKFFEALETTGQGHLKNETRKPEAPAADPQRVSHELLPKGLQKSGEKPVPVRSSSKPAPPPKPGIQPMSIHTEPTEKAVNFRRTEDNKFQARLKELEFPLQKDFAIKVTYVSQLSLDKPEDSLKMCFNILIQDCHQMSNEIVARNSETNIELEQLRRNANQCAAAAALNEDVRTQLQSVQQELASERVQNKKKRHQLEEKIDTLKSDIQNENAKYKRLEEETRLNNAIIMEMEDRLKTAEKLERIKPPKDTVEDGRILKLQEELQKEKHRRQELEDKLSNAMAQLEQLNCKLEGRNVTKETEICYDEDPVLVETIRTKAAEEFGRGISGLAIADNDLFITTFCINVIDVYNLKSLGLDRSWTLDALESPWDLAYCCRNKCLYVMDAKLKYILKVDLNGKLIIMLSTGKGYGCISVTNDCNILMADYKGNKITEYTSDGKIVLIIDLINISRGCAHPRHAIKLRDGRYLMSHGEGKDPLHRVCVVDRNGKIQMSFGGEGGSTTDRLCAPIYLAIDSNGSIFVVDRDNSRVLLLSSGLEFIREIISKEKGMYRPERMAFDQVNGRLLLSKYDDYKAGSGRVSTFKILQQHFAYNTL